MTRPCPFCNAEVPDNGCFIQDCHQCGTEWGYNGTEMVVYCDPEGFEYSALMNGITPEERAFQWAGWTGYEYKEYWYAV